MFGFMKRLKELENQVEKQGKELEKLKKKLNVKKTKKTPKEDKKFIHELFGSKSEKETLSIMDEWMNGKEGK